MIEYLSESEVFRVGMCMEEAGLDFYLKMAEKATDTATKRVFKRLARDEKEHLAYFESMEIETAGGLGARPQQQDEDTMKFVCSIVDDGIFKNIAEMEKVGSRKYNPEKALELALQVEKDAVLYYTEAHAATRKKRTKEALQRLVDEEKGHVVEITKRLANLRKKAAGKGRK
jgi:rubrerythrin